MTCPVCKAPSVGTKPCPGYCEGVEDGREESWRAILERDIAEVERALPGLRYDLRHDGRRRRVQVADCEAWLARARAALGGGQ